MYEGFKYEFKGRSIKSRMKSNCITGIYIKSMITVTLLRVVGITRINSVVYIKLPSNEVRICLQLGPDMQNSHWCPTQPL